MPIEKITRIERSTANNRTLLKLSEIEGLIEGLQRLRSQTQNDLQEASEGNWYIDGNESGGDLRLLASEMAHCLELGIENQRSLPE